MCTFNFLNIDSVDLTWLNFGKNFTGKFCLKLQYCSFFVILIGKKTESKIYITILLMSFVMKQAKNKFIKKLYTCYIIFL